ncbi:MAG: hypothetical protein ACRCYP_01500 [Alphaproteobacteria bacterium]
MQSWSRLALMGFICFSAAFGMEEEHEETYLKSSTLTSPSTDEESVTYPLNDRQILDAWEQMHHLASTRRDEVLSILNKLKNESLSIQERFDSTTKIAMPVRWQDIKIPNGLSKARQQESAQKKYILSVYSDMFVSYLCWNFLAESLKSYANLTSLEPEHETSLQQFFSRLVPEVANFLEFCKGDLKNYAKIRFYNEELSIGLFIYKQCEILANHWEKPILELFEKRSIKHPSVANNLERIVEGIDGQYFLLPEKTTKISSKIPFFAEQVIAHRKAINTNSKPFDFYDTDTKIRLFQSYVLTPSGPSLLEHIESGLHLPLPQVEKAVKPSKDKGEDKSKKGPPKKQKGKASKKNPQAKKKVVVEEESDSSSEYEEDITAPAPQPSAPPVKLRENEKKEPVSVATTGTLGHEPKRFQIHEIRPRVTYLSSGSASASYTYNGRSFSFPFKSVQSNYDERFLRKIKKMTQLGLKDPDKLPNLAAGWVNFHLRDRLGVLRFALEDIFLSGGKFFAVKDLGFKQQHRLVNTRHDMLTLQEKATIDQLPFSKISIPMGVAMEEKLRQKIARGGWKDNALDSEALLLLSLQKKLPGLLRSIAVLHPGATIEAVALGISTYHIPCSKCEHLIQGFQHNLPSLLWEAKGNANLQISQTLGSLALVEGQKTGRFEDKPITPTAYKIPSIMPDIHELTCIHPSHP